jgi:acyl transferase domain-containing protein
MREAFRLAGVSPGRVRYMEAHGTGTPVGDPIEANALGAVLGIDRPAGDRCVVGSVKTNIGHLEAAAGVAGLIKAILALERRQIPPHLHLGEPNPGIDFERLPLRVPRELEPWPDEPGPALAAVNSSGFGGANAHPVLAAAPAPAPRRQPPPEGPEPIALAARTPEALAGLARAHRARSEGGEAPPLADLAYTAARRRTHFEHRLAVVARHRGELDERLDAFLAGEERPGTSYGEALAADRRRLVWVFSGMGPQWWAMGRQLLAEAPVFADTVGRIDEIFTRHAGWSLLEEMTRDEESSAMAETRVSQPANFALQVGVAALLRSWGVEPDAIVGHSTGEVAAVCCAGAMSLDEATRVIYHRSRLQHTTTGQGKLVAVGLPVEEAEQAIAGVERVSLAAVNSPGSVTLAGDPESLQRVVEPLEQRGVFCRFLRVEVPFHSHYMDPLHEPLLEALDGLELGTETLPLYSTVTGRRIAGGDLGPPYWWRNVRDPVRFAAAIDTLVDDGYGAFLEIGPHPVLKASIGECLERRDSRAPVLSTLVRKEDEVEALLAAAGGLWALGVPLDWEALEPGDRRPADLPTYPWQRERYWDETDASRSDRLGAAPHPLLGRPQVTAHPTWQLELDAGAAPYLPDHRIQGAIVFPGAA